ncbi:hypothetical protein AJ78_05416 [Emergomyces pasteurianus Ep9510]|uniref:Uncharacterized protein n=1 Tax=Emergomyces pasteurianus Ep9510 TaxID=1447872 RepID=A0A1J9PDX5_9EURO|nr:hypothetical protein AJ78_05416 [Emergomyces pasteurianus Ep9510]
MRSRQAGPIAVDTENPFETVIVECAKLMIRQLPQARIRALYTNHRTSRNSRERAVILDSTFPGWSLDTTLAKLDGPARDPNFVDPRNCLALWARPPPPVRRLVDVIQSRLHDVAPSKWFMPPERLHLTVLDMANSLTEAEMGEMLSSICPGISDVVNYSSKHLSSLIKPMVSYDVAGLALSFVPAAGEANTHQGEIDRADGHLDHHSHSYTYHHLRRDIFSLVNGLGAKVAPRYIVPSAHITIARFTSQDGFVCRNGDGNSSGGCDRNRRSLDTKRIRQFISEIDSINEWLEREYWPRQEGSVSARGNWVVGEGGNGLECRKGRIWYGGRESIVIEEGLRHAN